MEVDWEEGAEAGSQRQIEQNSGESRGEEKRGRKGQVVYLVSSKYGVPGRGQFCRSMGTQITWRDD